MELIKDLTIGKLLRDTVLRYPDRPALKTRAEELSYKQLDEAVDMASRRLLYCGVKKGDHVGILCETQVEEIVVYYALARIGAVNVMFNTSLRAGELRELLDRSRVSVLLIGEGYRGVSFPALVANIMPDCPRLKSVYFIGSGDPGTFCRLDSLEQGQLRKDAGKGSGSHMRGRVPGRASGVPLLQHIRKHNGGMQRGRVPCASGIQKDYGASFRHTRFPLHGSELRSHVVLCHAAQTGL